MHGMLNRPWFFGDVELSWVPPLSCPPRLSQGMRLESNCANANLKVERTTAIKIIG